MSWDSLSKIKNTFTCCSSSVVEDSYLTDSEKMVDLVMMSLCSTSVRYYSHCATCMKGR